MAKGIVNPLLEEEEISPEEKAYLDAIDLIKSIDCVARFEREVMSWEAAAAAFEELGEYKDSQKQAQHCRSMSEKAKNSGISAAYLKAVDMQKEARSKIDFRTVISEFGRFPEYKDSQERIDLCKNRISRMENAKVWKGRGILALVLILVAVCLWVSPAKPFVKGYTLKGKGQYKEAIQNFQAAGNFLNSENQIKTCRYRLALKAREAGEDERALKLCRQAVGNGDADLMAATLEAEELKQAKPGDVVRFGSRDWTVAETNGQKLTLIYAGNCKARIFDGKGNIWADSKVRRWLNTTFKEAAINSAEKKMLQEVKNDSTGKKIDKVYLLSASEYTKYSAYVNVSDEFWLRDSEKGTASYVSKDKKVTTGGLATDARLVCPVIQISLDIATIQPTPSPTPYS